jgi:hypothetical protein
MSGIQKRYLTSGSFAARPNYVQKSLFEEEYLIDDGLTNRELLTIGRRRTTGEWR